MKFKKKFRGKKRSFKGGSNRRKKTVTIRQYYRQRGGVDL